MSIQLPLFIPNMRKRTPHLMRPPTNLKTIRITRNPPPSLQSPLSPATKSSSSIYQAYSADHTGIIYPQIPLDRLARLLRIDRQGVGVRVLRRRWGRGPGRRIGRGMWLPYPVKGQGGQWLGRARGSGREGWREERADLRLMRDGTSQL